MTFTPDSKVRLCSVPFSDYTNVLSFKNNDEARANYFISKTVYNLTDVNGYSYVKGNGAIRVNKSKDSLYNVNYMMYRNDHFGSKWFYAFVDSLEYINANVTEIRFSTDVWQTWESALNFHESFIVRQHIPKNEDTIGANLQPEGFTNLRYVEEKAERYDLGEKGLIFIVACVTFWNGSEFVKQCKTKSIDGVYSGLYYVPFYSSNSLISFVNKYLVAEADHSKEIIMIYAVAKEFIGENNVNFREGVPLGYNPNSDFTDSYTWSSLSYHDGTNKLTKIDIQPDPSASPHYVTPNNKKLLTFPFTKIVVTNNNGSSVTYRQEFFDDIDEYTTGDLMAFVISATPLAPSCAICYPYNYRLGDETEGLILNGYPQCSWVSDTYQQWLALNQNTLKYQQWTPIINLGVSNFNNMISSVTGGASSYSSSAGQIDSARTTQGQFSGIAGAIANRVSSIGTQINNSVNNVVSTGEQIWNFYAKKADMALQPNQANGTYNSANIMLSLEKLCFTVCYYRLSYEQFKQIDNYFDKFGYAINDFKAVNYHNRPNYDYIETSQVIIDGDVPEDDMNAIKNIFNSGVRIWHDTSTFLNYSAYKYNTSDKK